LDISFIFPKVYENIKRGILYFRKKSQKTAKKQKK